VREGHKSWRNTDYDGGRDKYGKTMEWSKRYNILNCGKARREKGGGGGGLKKKKGKLSLLRGEKEALWTLSAQFGKLPALPGVSSKR